MNKTRNETTLADQAGYKPAEFCAAVRISRSALYTMPEDMKPRSISFGRARIIIESPSDWLLRIAKQQCV